VVPRASLQSGAPAPRRPAAGRDLAVANPDRAFLPSLRDAVARSRADRRMYTDISDCEPLLAAIAAEFAADGVPAGHLGVASGAMDAIERALSVTLVPNDLLVLEDPTYPPYAEMARALDLRVARVPVDGRGLTADGLAAAVKAGAKALIAVPRGHNPTGAAFDAPRIRELERVLKAAPALMVVEDDYLGAVSGVPLATLVRRCERFVHVRSLGKALGPDLRVAPFCGDALTVARIRARQRIGYGWVSLVLQDAAAALVRDPATKRLTSAAARAYRERRECFVRALCARGVAVAPGRSGFTVWISVPDEAAAVAAARAAGFAIDGGARYRGDAPPGVRVTTTTLSADEAVRLAEALAGTAPQQHVR
jgi:DNA-binding transcriptional MocR family regulator